MTIHRLEWKRADAIAVATLLLLVGTGHWSQIIGWRQPVGGDKSFFFYGLMAYYGECLREGTLPLWNPRWGFGFASLAESQTGVFYPFHLALYWLLPAIHAFRWNLLLHRLLTGPVAYFAARYLGLRPLGAWVASACYVSGGFAVGHLDHQWAVESMLWTPAVLAATHGWLVKADRRALLMLPPLLCLQLLIGHYQIAFMTLVMASIYALGVRWTAWSVAPRPQWALVRWGFAVALGFGLAAVQLLPTYELQAYVRSANPKGWDTEYLSTHALPPWMLTNLVAPYLYFREPLWREVVWTPVRSAPEETFGYVGLLPLAIALGSMWRWRRVPLVRCWSLVFVAGLLLSFGPYLPGFGLLTKLPGFSFFRSAGRWILIQNLSIAMLAGWGVDHLRYPKRLFAWWRRFLIFLVVIAVLVAGWWFYFDRLARAGQLPPASLRDCVQRLTPWQGEPLADQMVRNLATPRKWDDYTLKLWVQTGRPNRPFRLVDLWKDVLVREMALTAAVCLGATIVLALACLVVSKPRRRRWIVPATIIAFCVIDLAIFRTIFPDGTAPMDKLVPDGPALSELRDLPKGTRVIGPGSNLLMAWGVSPLTSYRTLDVGWPPELSKVLAPIANGQPVDGELLKTPANSLIGLSRVVRYPLFFPEGRQASAPAGIDRLLEDDQLGWWLDGSLGYETLMSKSGWRPATGFSLVNPPTDSPTAPPTLVIGWERLIYSGFSIPSLLTGGERLPALEGLYASQSVEWAGSATPTGPLSWKVNADQLPVLVIGSLYLPGWRARIENADGVRWTEVMRMDGYWQAVPFRYIGESEVSLHYTPPGLKAGAVISVISALIWLGCVARRRRAAIGTCK